MAVLQHSPRSETSHDAQCYAQLCGALQELPKSTADERTQDPAFNTSLSQFPPPAAQESPGLPLQILPYVPVLISIISASLAVGGPPLYFNVRHIVIICGILGSWTTSHILGIVIPRTMAKRRKKLSFWLLTIKNAVFAIIPPMLLGMQTCGLFNTCRGWAPIVITRHGRLRFGGVVLEALESFKWNVEVFYPWLVLGFLVVQGGYGLGVWMWFRSAKMETVERFEASRSGGRLTGEG
ncbi:hypothetical protein QBC42DRAFT_296190 [Cladorrhinum samala]|uniref:Uncharacterized protein n=1 Tax=Cladorrhinum samala TaxID=585594 RepID=A0AAV9HTE9_9PEZI|nr:hypothetical protein QBC42DRAFT_296190 [Cladorrhinum samala]